MYDKPKSRRVRAMIVGTLLTSVMAIGATADTASAAKPDKTNGSVVVVVEGPVSLMSGIRW